MTGLPSHARFAHAGLSCPTTGPPCHSRIPNRTPVAASTQIHNANSRSQPIAPGPDEAQVRWARWAEALAPAWQRSRQRHAGGDERTSSDSLASASAASTALLAWGSDSQRPFGPFVRRCRNEPVCRAVGRSRVAWLNVGVDGRALLLVALRRGGIATALGRGSAANESRLRLSRRCGLRRRGYG